jgi:hypothetical protein
MSQALQIYASDPQSAHRACLAGWDFAKRLTSAGKAVEVSVKESEDERSLRANRFYWGYVLKTIAHQASIGGQRYQAEAWHELFKRQFLGYEVKKATVAGRRKKLVTRTLRSTSKASVRQFVAYLEQIMAFAATDMGVAWQVEYTVKQIVNSKARGMVIDAETGEIVEGL